jgi:uncharacterized membrane protein
MLHLIHPGLVHFSVSLLILGGSVEAWALLAQRDGAGRFGGLLVTLGTISLLPAIVSGYLAANTVQTSTEAGRVLEAHETNGLLLIGLFVVAQFWKGWFRGDVPPGQRPFYAGLLIIGVLLAAYSAYLGGELVYGHGVGLLTD